MNHIFPKDEISIGTNYILQLKNLLGSGSFGKIYKGKNTPLNIDLAIKCEPLESKHHQRLKYESIILTYLQGGKYPPPLGIPALYDFLTSKHYNYMMMELLGPSLEDLFDIYNYKFTLKTILSLGDQMLSRIEFLHSRHLIHRDIKPDNFLMGIRKNKSIVHICDFGLCKQFRDKNGKHIPFKEGKAMAGTARYASINSHLGFEQSRRDDLESLTYSLIYFSRGSLPWMNIKAETRQEKQNKILQIKLNSKVNFLCEKLPIEFIDFVNYIRNLAFDDKPDYLYLKTILKKLYDKYEYNYDKIFDFSDYLIEKENEEEKEEKKIIKKQNLKFPLALQDKKEIKENKEKDSIQEKIVNQKRNNEQ